MANTLLNVLKFLLAVVLIPAVYTTVITFQAHLVSYPVLYVHAFTAGIITCLAVFLFLYQFWGLYELEHKMTSGIFRFLAPLDRWLAFLLPTFFILTMGLLFVICRVIKVEGLEGQLTFLAGLFLSMHILVLSQDLQNPDKGLTKPGYLVILALTVILSLFAAILMMDMVTQYSTFDRFSKQWLSNTEHMYQTVTDRIPGLKK